MYKPALFLLILLLNFNLALALNCDAPETTADMVECSGILLKEKDAELNTVYKQVLKLCQEEDRHNNKIGTGYSFESKKKLVEAQKLWIQFRDKDCDSVGDYNGGGSISPVMYLGCLIDRTEQRTKELKGYIWDNQ